MDDLEMQNLIYRKTKKWPNMFWFLMRVLALFYHRIIVCDRKCYSCHVQDVSDLLLKKGMNGMDADLNFYILAYESSSNDATDQIINTELQVQDRNRCSTCQTLWWNCFGVPSQYNDRDIGVSQWAQRWNGVISSGWLMVAIAVLVYDLVSFLLPLFGSRQEILNLMMMLSLYVLLAVHYIFALCSKLRSIFKSAVPKLSWATCLNARYLVKRAQLLDMSNRGLPGLPFLILCVLCPLVLSTYRMVIFLYISDCDVSVYNVAQSVVGVIFMVNWGFHVYIFYFIRVSFQCQLNLVLSFIKKFENDISRCRAVVLDVTADFACYHQLCVVLKVTAFPAAVLAVVVNITTAYMNNKSDCVVIDKQGILLSQHIAVLAWSEVVMALLLYATAMGGYNVHYIWENFVRNVLALKVKTSKLHKKLQLKEAEYLLKESNVLIVTIIFSITGIFVGFHFGDQSVDFLNHSCNVTYPYYSCT